jgi:hypothetical protein
MRSTTLNSTTKQPLDQQVQLELAPDAPAFVLQVDTSLALDGKVCPAHLDEHALPVHRLQQTSYLREMMTTSLENVPRASATFWPSRDHANARVRSDGKR